MTTIAARAVRSPRKRYLCDWCERPIDGEHICLYGHADDHTPPFTVRLHATERCCPNHTRDPKIGAALGQLRPAESEAAHVT